MTSPRPLPSNIPPRGLTRDQAAEFVGLSAGSFVEQVKAGILPPPISFGRRKVWDVQALNSALDRLSGLQAISTGDQAAEIERLLNDRR